MFLFFFIPDKYEKAPGSFGKSSRKIGARQADAQRRVVPASTAPV
jgi:hypothetical protein